MNKGIKKMNKLYVLMLFGFPDFGMEQITEHADSIEEGMKRLKEEYDKWKLTRQNEEDYFVGSIAKSKSKRIPKLQEDRDGDFYVDYGIEEARVTLNQYCEEVECWGPANLFELIESFN